MKKLKNIVTIGAFLLIAIAGIAQKNENSLLWKIEGQGIQTSYVFGTFHMLPKEDFLLKDKVKDAFTASELIVLELDMDDPSMQTEMLKHSTLPDGTTLLEYMDTSEFELIDTYLKSRVGVGLEQFKSFKPFLVSSMIMMGYLGQDHASYEGSLMVMAKEQQKEIKGLETIAYQMNAFDMQPYEEQMDDIVKLLNEKEGMATMFTNMITNYKKEDIDGLYDFMDDYFIGMGQMDVMLHNRNANWIPKIAAYSSTQTVFYGVGAGHLGGALGVLNLLRKAGYTVTPIKG